ncbi:MAG TPA: HD domain-containing phosphohydrolase [Coriobacteriia bacterium]|nr:HD domain-containing phosphohydrolase [Coriobacteriia bacterium]
MDFRLIGSATIAAAAAGVAGVASGVAFSAWVLMALGLALTIVAAGIALTMALRHQAPVMPAAPTLELHGPPEEAHRDRRHDLRAGIDAMPDEPRMTAEIPPETPATVGAGEGERIAPAVQPPRIEPSGVGPREVLEAFLLSCQPAGEVLSAHLWLMDQATQTMRLVEAVGSAKPNSEPMAVARSILGAAATGEQAVLSSNVRMARDDEELPVWRYAVPLRAGSARGAAAVDIVAEEPDEAFLIGISEHLHGALAAALAIHVARTETAAAEALLEAAGEIVRLVDPQSIVESALQRALALSNSESGSVMLLESDGGMRIRASRGLPEHVVSEAVVREGDGIAGMVLATGQALVVEDLQGKGGRARRHGVKSAVAVPIADDEGLLGVLNVGSREFHARFSASHRATLESLGRIVAMALRNAWALSSSRELYLDTVKALALALETKDPYSYGSTERVYDLSTAIGKRLGLSERENRALGVAALLHDIGMVAAGNVGCLGDRPLTTVERGLLKLHPVIAADVLSQAAALKDAVPIVYHHHEHYDGHGYVLGVAGEAIPVGARVLAVADAYVSMTSPRSYREPFSHADALFELEDKAGTQFDPRVVRAFLDISDSVRISASC